MIFDVFCVIVITFFDVLCVFDHRHDFGCFACFLTILCVFAR